MKKINVITIDGPSASGKGALSRRVAKHFNLNILDSGVLYRLFAFFFNLNINHQEISDIIKHKIDFKLEEDSLRILNQDIDITSDLRTEDIAKIASELSTKEEVRNLLFNIQRDFYDTRGLVADGRDMGTVVFKDAKLKIFLTASPEVRAKRRYLELQNLGQEVNMPALIADIKLRDLKDSSRELSPLLAADDAITIDSSEMSLEEVFSLTENLIKKEFI